jgi:hypothetical protein
MKKNTNIYILIASMLLLPVITLAAPFDGVKGLLQTFLGMLNSLIPLIFGLALIYFFWGTAQFVLHSGEQKARDEGKQKMLWGIIAIFVFVSIWGILGFIGNTLGIPVTNGVSSYETPLGGF